MGKLNNAYVYLSGPIDCAKDYGVSWRKELIDKCNHLNLKFFDPTNKKSYYQKSSNLNNEQEFIENCRANKKWEELQKFVKKFRREDLRCVDLTDFIIAYINIDIFTCGTFDEIFTAEDQQKPILCICEGGKEKLPTWLFGVFKLDEIFSTIDECVEYLNKINKNEIELDDRWVLMRKKIINL